MPVLESPHAQREFESPAAELESTLGRFTDEQAEAATSSHLVRMIDFFFALVLGQGLLQFKAVLEAPFAANVQVWLALGLIYYTVVRSFIGWHVAIETGRYRMLSNRRTTELWRVYVDILIVVLYAYMLFAAKPLIENPAVDIAELLWALPVLFVLYGVWGQLRRIGWGEDEFDLRVLTAFILLYTLLVLAYTVIPSGTLSIGNELGNTLALATAWGLMALYRYINFWQGDESRRRWFRKKIPTPRIPPFDQPPNT